MRFGTTTWRIDGGPTDADTWAFLFDLGVSLTETAASPSSDRFKRFAGQGRAPGPRRPQPRSTAELKKFSEYFTRFVDSSRTESTRGAAPASTPSA